MLLLEGCGSTPPKEPLGPDAKALEMETLVQARAARIVLSARWRTGTKVEGIGVEEPVPGTQVARGSAVFALQGLRIEAEEIRVTWLPETDTLLVSATDVHLFRQRRGQPYETRDLAMLTMANDQVSFFQK